MIDKDPRRFISICNDLQQYFKAIKKIEPLQFDYWKRCEKAIKVAGESF